LADIGGTYVRLALETAPARLRQVEVRACSEFESVSEVLLDYLHASGVHRVRHAAIGIATAVTSDRVCMTNHHWAFSIQELQSALGLDTLLVLNDFTALALALPRLPAAELHQIGGGAAHAECPVGLIGPGTGLGVSALIPCAEGFVALAGEGGHARFAPYDDEDAAIWRIALARFGVVSAERLLSGPGLVLIHQARLQLLGLPEQPLSAQEITGRALSGACPECSATLDCFCAMLGSAAGNLALTLGARGGIYIGGGIVPRLGDSFARSSFRRRFEQAGRMSDYLTAIPVFVIHSAHPGLHGAAAALDAHFRKSLHA
jgi:glucokinase